MMKKPLYYVLLWLLCATVWSCSDDGQDAAPEVATVTFTIGAPIDATGRIAAGTRPTTLLLSLINDRGTPVFTMKTIKLIAVGDQYITEPIELAPGFYKVADFILADDAKNFLYAVPKKGSPLEKAVDKPLPLRFPVVTSDLNTISLQVVDIAHNTPADFGYTSFSFDVANALRISVFARQDDQIALRSASAYILHNNDTIKKLMLEPKVNLISFTGDPQANYTLVVAKKGYNPYKLDFLYEALADSLTNLSLRVNLNPALTITPKPGSSMTFHLMTMRVSTFYVSWGDGTNEVYTTTSSGGANYVEIRHAYTSSDNDTITVTGDLDYVHDFSAFYDNAWFDAVDLSSMVNLEAVNIGWMQHGPAVIDLRYNPRVRHAQLSNNRNLTSVLLPVDNQISNLILSGPNQLDAADIDDIINRIYNAAIQRNANNGNLDIRTAFGEYTLIGPPSASTLHKLEELYQTRRWRIPPWPELPPL